MHSFFSSFTVVFLPRHSCSIPAVDVPVPEPRTAAVSGSLEALHLVAVEVPPDEEHSREGRLGVAASLQASAKGASEVRQPSGERVKSAAFLFVSAAFLSFSVNLRKHAISTSFIQHACSANLAQHPISINLAQHAVSINLNKHTSSINFSKHALSGSTIEHALSHSLPASNERVASLLHVFTTLPQSARVSPVQHLHRQGCCVRAAAGENRVAGLLAAVAVLRSDALDRACGRAGVRFAGGVHHRAQGDDLALHHVAAVGAEDGERPAAERNQRGVHRALQGGDSGTDGEADSRRRVLRLQTKTIQTVTCLLNKQDSNRGSDSRDTSLDYPPDCMTSRGGHCTVYNCS